MAPFTFDLCPRCAVKTKQRFLDSGENGDISFICEKCYLVLTYHADESVECRESTGEERAFVPPPVVWSEQEWADYWESIRQGQAGVREWLQAGCPGLTPELEQALPAGTIAHLRDYLRSVDDAGETGEQAEPTA